MLTLQIRTEYSFRFAYGHCSKIIEFAKEKDYCGIADRSGTWGHVPWQKICLKEKVKPIFGIEIAVQEDLTIGKKLPISWMTLLAKNSEGLQEIYDLVSIATSQSYYVPRISYTQLKNISVDVFVLIGSNPIFQHIPTRSNFLLNLSPITPASVLKEASKRKMRIVATSDNLYPRAQDKLVYEVLVGQNREMRTAPSHILNKWEWLDIWPGRADNLLESDWLAAECNAELPQGEMVKPARPKTLEKMCNDAAKRRKINLKDPIYKERLRIELELIHEKKFDDYFYVIADMCRFARQHMLVGPARGSSCGSLACYLLDITEVDPIPYNLLFERFIDLNRTDLPDVDIDFPEDKRELVFDYLRKKYGADCVARLGTISRFKAKSTITDVSKALNIPLWEVQDLRNSMIERSEGDSRSAFCIMDTFNELEVGKKLLLKYPQLSIASEIEGHARHSGQHSAGVIITERPVINFCSVDSKNGCAQIDKIDAEHLNLLKIDVLGLRTLSVIEDILEQISWTREQFYSINVKDKKAFKVLNDGLFAGVFQFEGYALQSLTRQIKVEDIEDIISITALARPGPLISGGAAEFIRRKNKQKPATPLHPLIAEFTDLTYGIVVYQEQVMSIARKMGQMTWKDVSTLRKAMSKSLGKEFFDQYWMKFAAGAASHGISEEDALHVWDNVNTMGSWSFNRSHAVAYGLLSFYCAYLKAHFPLQFAVACLRHAKDNDQQIKLLRELVHEGFKYKPFDVEKSEENWTVQDGVLIGGFLGVHGIGPAKAAELKNCRASGKPLSVGTRNLLAKAKTPYDNLFEAASLWKDIFENPIRYQIKSELSVIETMTDLKDQRVCFIAKMTEKNLRDSNELINVQRRGGKLVEGQTRFINMTFEDDTGNIMAQITVRNYLKYGVPILEERKVGDWFVVRGNIRKGFRKVYIDRIRYLDPISCGYPPSQDLQENIPESSS